MAKMRYLKVEAFTDEKMLFLSDSAWKLFYGLIVYSDDAGVHPYELYTIKVEIFGADNKTIKKIEKLIAELSTAELIETYSVGKKKYIRIPTFDKHQWIAPDRKYFKHPNKKGEIPKKSKSYKSKSTALSSDEAPHKRCLNSAEADQKQCPNPIVNNNININENENGEGDARERASTDSPPPDILFKFLTADNKCFNLDQGAVDAYVDRFPNCNVAQILAKIEGWLEANPTKRWRFIKVLDKVNNWLAEEDQKAVAV